MQCVKCKKDIPDESIYCLFCGQKQVASKQGRKAHARANGTGSVYKRGHTWEAAVVVGYKLIDGKSKCIRRTKGGFQTKTEALLYLPQLQEQRAAKKPPTIHELYDQWLSGPYKKLSASKQCAYRIAFGKLEDIQFCQIDLLTVADLQRVVDDKAPTFYPAKDIKSLLSHLYQRAMADQFVTINLSDFLVLPDLETQERQAFSSDEIRLLWDDYAAGNRFTGYILLMIYTGMMPGELLKARKDQINWESKTITGAGKKTKIRKETPIVLADIILPVLADLCENTTGEKLIVINRDNFYTKYHKTMARAGCRDLPPYSCRHSTATALALDNIAPSVIQKIMRHSKFTTTQGYIHVDVSPMLDAINQMADKIGMDQPTQQPTQQP